MLGHNAHSQSFHPNLGGPGCDGPTWRGTKIEVRGLDRKASKGLVKYNRGFTEHPKATPLGRAGGSQAAWVCQAVMGRRMGLRSPLPSPRQATEAPRHWLLSHSHEQIFPPFRPGRLCLPPDRDQPKTRTLWGQAAPHPELFASRVSKMSEQQATSPRISLPLGGQGSFCFPTAHPVCLTANSS